MDRFHVALMLAVASFLTNGSESLIAQVDRSSDTQAESKLETSPKATSTDKEVVPVAASKVGSADQGAHLETILQRWFAESSDKYPIYAIYTRSDFNHIYETETRTSCKCLIDSPHCWMIEMTPVDVKKAAPSLRKNKQGMAYKLEAGPGHRFLCTGDSFLLIDDKLKTYDTERIVPKAGEQLDLRIKLPLRLLAAPADAQRLLKLSIVNETDSLVRLLGVPQEQAMQNGGIWGSLVSWFCGDSIDFEKIAITLDKSTFLPKKIHIQDVVKNDTVFTIETIEFLSEKARISEWYPNDGVDWKELQGYQPVLPPPEVN